MVKYYRSKSTLNGWISLNSEPEMAFFHLDALELQSDLGKEEKKKKKKPHRRSHESLCLATNERDGDFTIPLPSQNSELLYIDDLIDWTY